MSRWPGGGSGPRALFAIVSFMLKALPLFVLWTLPALAEARLAVVELSAPPNVAGLATQLTHAVEANASEQGYTVISPNDVRASLGDDGIQAVQRCVLSSACVAEQLATRGVPLAVVGQLDRDDER